MKKNEEKIQEKCEQNSHHIADNKMMPQQAKKAKCKGSQSFFRLDPTYGPRLYDTTNKVMPVSQDQLESTESNPERRHMSSKQGRDVSNPELGKSNVSSTRENPLSSSIDCKKCERTFKNRRGLNQHLKKCKAKDREDIVFEMSSRDMDIENSNNKNFWNEADTSFLEQRIDEAYQQISCWRKMLFLVPSGAAGKSFIEEMTKLINGWTFKSRWEKNID